MGIRAVLSASGCAAALLLSAGQALAWGDSGHRMIGVLAIETLPDSLPAFLRSQQAAGDIGEWAREPDRWRGSGAVHDNMRDPGHFVDVGDDGRILGGPALADLPPTRTDYVAALAAVRVTEAKAGFLPYTIIDGYQQAVKDFATWRTDKYALAHESDPVKRAWIARDLARREQQTIMDIGIWGHYVGDGSQPMHASVHYNGWGPGPNPDGFTDDKVHVPWEGPYVRDNVRQAAVRADMSPLAAPDDITRETERYLAATQSHIVEFFTLEKSGGLKPGNAALLGFTAQRVADGASEFRDLIAAAWKASDRATLGYPPVSVADIEAGKVKDVYGVLAGDN